MLADGACPSPATAGTCSTTIHVLPAGEVEPQLHCQTAFMANRESCPPLVTNFQVKLENLLGVPSTDCFWNGWTQALEAVHGRGSRRTTPQPCGVPALGRGVSETQQEDSIMLGQRFEHVPPRAIVILAARKAVSLVSDMSYEISRGAPWAIRLHRH